MWPSNLTITNAWIHAVCKRLHLSIRCHPWIILIKCLWVSGRVWAWSLLYLSEISVYCRFRVHQNDAFHLQHVLYNIYTICRDHSHSVYAPSQWETALQCNAVSCWLGSYTECSLHLVALCFVVVIGFMWIQAVTLRYIIIPCQLTHCGLVTPYGDWDLGQHWLKIMACCLTAPSHYLNQCWITINMVQWHSYKGSFPRDTSVIDYENQLENYSSEIYFETPKGQRIKSA